MTATRGNFSERFTFSQRYGYEPLPEPMQPGRISEGLRRQIWNVVRASVERELHRDAFGEPHLSIRCRKFMERLLGSFLELPHDEVDTQYDRLMDRLKRIILKCEYNKLLDLLELAVNDHCKEIAARILVGVKLYFHEHASPYRLDTSQNLHRFLVYASREQAEATRLAIERIREGGMDSAAAHLRDAAEHLNVGQHADSIADSIHAVESVARIIDPKSNKTLGPALESLEKASVLKHPALKQAFVKLYGYTNTEQGIRHALLDKNTADVGVEEAIFMFGACASFAAYLTETHRKAGSA